MITSPRETWLTGLGERPYDIQFLKRAGFNSIRVPIHYKHFQSDDSEEFRLLDQVVEWSSEAGMYVVIDMYLCARRANRSMSLSDRSSQHLPRLGPCSYRNKHTREESARVATPAGTPTHKPIPHSEVVEKLIEVLSFRQYAASSNIGAHTQSGLVTKLLRNSAPGKPIYENKFKLALKGKGAEFTPAQSEETWTR